MFSKTVQLSLQNKDKIVHTTHTYHIFPPMALAHSHRIKREQKKINSNNARIYYKPKGDIICFASKGFFSISHARRVSITEHAVCQIKT